MSSALLELIAVEKSYPGVRALRPLHAQLQSGEIVGLVGENGAGKSTLIKILSGVIQPDAGELRWNGRTVRLQGPGHALELGVATIHQELAYFGHLSVAENLLLSQSWPRRRWGGIDWPMLHGQAQQLLDRFELGISSRSVFHELSAAQKQEVAIIRALSRQARLLILDEPTASLSEPEALRLFDHLNRLRSEGVAILYVSHRLHEILELTDRILVLRDGEQVASYRTAEAGLDRIVKDMVGRPLEQIYPNTREGSKGAPLLQLEGVSRAGLFQEITFNVRAGEIVGLAGLVGAGRSELARAIYGLYPYDQGQIHCQGKPWRPAHPQEALQAGLVYLPEERKRHGLVLDHSIADSISIGFSDLIQKGGLIPRRLEQERVLAALRTFLIRAAQSSRPVGSLSGGNQQKSLLARWLDRDPQILILDEPTRGVDIAAKAEIHALMDALATRGKALLLISSDLPEVLGLSDRVLVMHAGKIAAELAGDWRTQENVLLAASGLWRPPGAKAAAPGSAEDSTSLAS